MDEETAFMFIRIKYFPFIIAGLASLVSALVMAINKRRNKKFIFEHFYLMAIGMLLFIIGGSLLINRWSKKPSQLMFIITIHDNIYFLLDPQIGFYCSFGGHGIAYIPIISYLNIRSSKNGRRTLKISLCHTIYILGIAIGVTISLQNVVPKWNAPKVVNKFILNSAIGYSVLSSSLLIFIGYIINELMHFFKRKYNYKMSLDVDFERENKAKAILRSKFFATTDSEGNRIEPPVTQHEKQMTREIGTIILAITSKAANVACFYYPFIYMNYAALSHSLEILAPLVHWTAVLSAIAGSYLIHKVSLKSSYLLADLVKILILMVLVGYTSLNIPDHTFPSFLAFINYFLLSFSYSYPNIINFELISFKYNEIVMAMGYFIEMNIIGIPYYGIITDYDRWFCIENSFFSCLLRHAVPFIVVMILSIILSIIFLPDMYNHSLLESKNKVKLFNYKKWWQPQISNNIDNNRNVAAKPTNNIQQNVYIEPISSMNDDAANYCSLNPVPEFPCDNMSTRSPQRPPAKSLYPVLNLSRV